jgi:hypothetical protein
MLKRYQDIVIWEESQPTAFEFMSACVDASDSGTVIDLHLVAKELP